MTKSASTTTALLMALFVQQTNSTNVSKYRMKTSRENKAMFRFRSALFFFTTEYLKFQCILVLIELHPVSQNCIHKTYFTGNLFGKEV